MVREASEKGGTITVEEKCLQYWGKIINKLNDPVQKSGRLVNISRKDRNKGCPGNPWSRALFGLFSRYVQKPRPFSEELRSKTERSAKGGKNMEFNDNLPPMSKQGRKERFYSVSARH
ncbi:hypothetical protein JTB14_024075 [Gonioctena quinquepunctata]|nr:hypothetical protein JTB14_024075 [Gonioctena quinquepunctata]